MPDLRQLLRLSRRHFLALPAFLALPRVDAAALPELDAAERSAVLAAFVDVLIPADELTPAASKLGIHDEILADNPDGPVGSLIDNGCAWLQLSTSGSWLEMNDAQRERLVNKMEQAPANRLSNLFFRYLRDQAMRRYYAKPASWRGLGTERPPQPRGYTELVKHDA